MTPLLKKPLLFLWVSLSLCLGLAGCSSGPTFYDEAAPLTPPPFTPPPLKATEAPLSSENLDDVAPLDSQPTVSSGVEASLSHSGNQPVNESNAIGPLSSPMPSLSKKSVSSQNNDGILKKR